MKTSRPCFESLPSERLNSDGYTRIRVAKNTWKLKQRVIWEENYGLIPKKHVIIFADGNRENFDLSNLIMISRRKHAMMNKNKLIKNDSDATKTGLIIADILLKITDRKKAKGWDQPN